MTTVYHTPLANGDPATAATFNLPLSALDTAIGNTQTNSAITGGTIDGTVIGGTTPAAGNFTSLEVQGNSDDLPVLIKGNSNKISIGMISTGDTASDAISLSPRRYRASGAGTLLNGDVIFEILPRAQRGGGASQMGYLSMQATQDFSLSESGTEWVLAIIKNGSPALSVHSRFDTTGLDVADAVRGLCLRADGDPIVGLAQTTTLTNATGTPTDTANPSSWIKLYVGTQAGYIPFHNA